MKFENKTIVFGSNHHNTLGIIRSLGEKGLKPYLILVTKVKKPFIVKSKYIEKTFYTQNYEEGLDILINNFSQENNKPIIFCSNDKAAEVIDANYDHLKEYFYVQNAGKSNALLPYFDKLELCKKAKEWGFEVPLTYCIKRTDDIPKDIIYPCIVKPLKSIKGKKSDIRVCNSDNELKNTIVDLSNLCEDILIQQYIEKEYEVSILGLSLQNDIVLLPGMIHKLREYPVKRGSSSFARLEDIPEELDIKPLYRAIKDVGYIGLFSIEFVKKDNKYYFLEINFRNDGNGYVITSAGMNQPYIFCLDVLGMWSPNDEINVKLPHYFMNDGSDLFHISDRNLSLSSWYKDYKRTNCFLRYNELDPAPTNGSKFSLRMILSCIKRMLKNRK